MQTLSIQIAFTLLFSISNQGIGQELKSTKDPASISAPKEMENFEQLIPGMWMVTAASGQSMFHTWHWGPGKHSIRRLTDGFSASGEPWREHVVYYYHPGRKEICVLGFSPYDRGISEGTIAFDGETANGAFDLYQTRGRRNMGIRWRFSGPDKYREVLLENSDGKGMKPLVEFEQIREKTPTTRRSQDTDESSNPSEFLKPLESLIGRTWDSEVEWNGKTFHIQSTSEWIPLADVIHVKTILMTKDGNPENLLDGYIYHHTGTKTLRCLFLSNQGGVYAGQFPPPSNGSFRIDLTSNEGNRETKQVASLEFQEDGTILQSLLLYGDSLDGVRLNLRHKVQR